MYKKKETCSNNEKIHLIKVYLLVIFIIYDLIIPSLSNVKE